jgi:hypothetical protein
MIGPATAPSEEGIESVKDKGSFDHRAKAAPEAKASKKGYRTFTIEINHGGGFTRMELSRVATAWGLKVEHADVLMGSHPIGAIQRYAVECRQASSKILNHVDQVVVLDPREGEVELFKRLLLESRKSSLRPAGIQVQGRRLNLLGAADAAECRKLLNPILAPHRLNRVGHKRDQQEVSSKKKLTKLAYAVVGNDNAYWYNIEGFFSAHKLMEFPNFDKFGVHCMLSLFDFRTSSDEGFSLFLPRYRVGEVLPECPGDRSFPALDLMEQCSIKEDGHVTHYASIGERGAVETVYNHPFLAGEFFEFSRKVFSVNGVVYTASIHVDCVVGNKYLLNVKYTRFHPDDREEKVKMPMSALIDGGFVPALYQVLRQQAWSFDETSTSGLKSYWRLVHAEAGKIIPTKFRSRLLPWERSIAAAIERTGHRALYDALPDLGPLEGRGKNLKDIAQEGRVQRSMDRWGFERPIAEVCVRTQTDSTKVEFALELCAAFKSLLLTGWEKVKNLFHSIREWMRGDAPAVELDLVRLLRRLLHLAPPVKRALNVVERTLGNWGWLTNQRTQMLSLAAEHPLFFNALTVLVELTLSLVRVMGEESFKRVAAPMFLILSGLEVICDLVEWYYDDHHHGIALTRVLRDALFRTIAHGLLVLTPYPVAVVLHWAWNAWHGKGLRFYRDLYSALKEEQLSEIYVDAEVDASDFREFPESAVPVSLLVETSVGIVPLVTRPDIIQSARDRNWKCSKLHVLRNDASALIVKPTGSLLEVACLIASRLDVPLPYSPLKGAVKQGYRAACELYFGGIYSCQDLSYHVEPWTNDEFLTYLKGQEFGAEKYKLYEDRVRESESLQGPAVKPFEFYGKTDETLPNNPMHEGAQKTVKARPIFPIQASQLELMKFILPFKKRFEKTIKVVEPLSGCQHTFTYVMNSRPDILDAWHNEYQWIDGVHVLCLGDDNYTLFVNREQGFFGPNALAFAYDMVKCDRTCGYDFQRCFGDFLLRCGLSLKAYTDFLLSCKGLRKVTPKKVSDVAPDPQEEPSFWWNQEFYSTITGNPATSLQAFFAQMFFFGRAWWGWIRGPLAERRIENLIERITQSATLNGHILEWEKTAVARLGTVGPCQYAHIDRPYGSPYQMSFLGGYWVDDGEAKWFAFNFLKSATIFPDTKRIYTHDHVAMHCAAMAQDPVLSRTPLGRAFTGVFTRVAKRANLTDEDWRAAVIQLEASKRWWFKGRTKCVLSPISMDAWLSWLDQFYCSRDLSVPFSEHESLLEELSTVDSLPFFVQTPCVRLLYYPRFGWPKLETDDRLALDLLPKMTQLGNRVLSALNRLFFMSKQEKKIVRDVAKQVARQEVREQKRVETKDVRRQRKRKTEEASKAVVTALRSNTSGGQGPEVRAEITRLMKQFNPSYVEKAAYQYLLGLINPWIPGGLGSPHGRPVSVRTRPYQVRITGGFQSNASGFACLCMVADNWQPKSPSSSGNINDMLTPTNPVLGTVGNGPMIWGTTNTYVGTTIPNPVTLVPPSTVGVYADVPGGSPSNVDTIVPGASKPSLNAAYRLVSMECRVVPISAESTTAGQMCAFRKRNMADSSSGNVPVGRLYAEIAGGSEDIWDTQEVSISEWVPGKWLKVTLIPTTGVAMKMWPLLANGTNTGGAVAGGFIINATPANQGFRYEAVANYEFTEVPSYAAADFHKPLPLEINAADVPSAGLLALRPNQLVNATRQAHDYVNIRPAAQAMADHKTITEGSADEGWFSSIVNGATKAAPFIESAATLLASLL